MPADSNVKVGTAALIIDDGKLLMIQRQGSDGAGTWSIPGGWLEFGETPGEAAAREAKEETNIDVIPVDDGGVITFPSDDGTTWIVDVFVECLWVGGEPQVMEPDKCPVVKWVLLGDLPSPLFEPLRQLAVERGWA